MASYLIQNEPYYRPTGEEVKLFEAMYARRMPLVLKGPTGCGKTRFIEHMAWRLRKPLVTIACNEDLSATDLVGRYLLDGSGTVWRDGPLTAAVRHGAICYLDEIVEARADTTVVIHPLADDRRILPLDRLGEILHAHQDFQLVMSYNPGYQNSVKDLKASTRQRFGALNFRYPHPEVEVEIVEREAGIERSIARNLVGIAARSRELRGRGIEEGISTRMLVRAGTLIADGIEPHDACKVTLTRALSDDEDVVDALDGFVDAYFGP